MVGQPDGKAMLLLTRKTMVKADVQICDTMLKKT